MSNEIKPTESARVLSTIPFSGFYESIHGEAIDDAIERLFIDNEGIETEIPDAFWNRWDGKPVFEAFARLYTETLKEKLAEDFDVDLSSMAFKELLSPKEYNFETDVIIVELSVEQVKAMYSSIDKDELKNEIKEQCTSRSGFMSFYPNDLNEWLETDIAKWDKGQIGILLEVYTDNLNLDLSENKQDAISELVYANMSDKCKAIVDKFYELNDGKNNSEEFDGNAPTT